MPRVPSTLVSALMSSMLVLSACGNGDPLAPEDEAANGAGDGDIIVGSADFTGNVVLAEIYAGALREAGADVTTQFRVGTREALIRGLEDGSVDVIPEYTGNLLAYLDESANETEPDAVYDALGENLPEDLSVLDPAEAEDSDVLVVTESTAQDHELATIGDLAPLCEQFTLGAAGEWTERWEGSMAEIYGCEFADIQPTDAGGPVTVEALNDGEVDVANLFTTSPAIEEQDFVRLTDTERMYPAQNIVPLYRDGTLDSSATDVLNEVSDALDTESVAEMLARVEQDNENATDVATSFLEDSGIAG